ncbi:MAG: hypothetical protein GTO14_24565, partial [Anaerolineales bacterium]|nr:hypothetical protein [Anaerolineales bacterium]
MDKTVYSFAELPEEMQSSAGGKGGSLAHLYQAGFPVPVGFVILPTSFSGDDLRVEAWKEAEDQLVRLRALDADMAFAVRSSALSEDSVEASFAGEFETVLNARSNEEIRGAITTVFRSRKSERVQAYSEAKGMSATHEVAVVVQQLVDAERSGILFTANPVTGHRDQVVINAAWGLGEAVVGGIVTPDTLTMDKATAKVLTRETADKQVMTVRLASGTEEQPVPKRKRRARVLSDSQAAKLMRLGVEIEAFYGMPMDIEWVLAEEEFSIVQARPITALPEPMALAPTEWNFRGIAMRNNIVELMADPMTPLFGTLGLAAINASMNRQMDHFLGKTGLMPEGPIVSVNDYAFYNGSMKLGQIVQILLRSVGIVKRMMSRPVERWVEVGRPRYISTIERWRSTPW